MEVRIGIGEKEVTHAIPGRRIGFHPGHCAVWAFSAFLLGACSLPEHMEVRSGIDPRNQDDDVRFRTTYYLRVLDACTARSGEGGSTGSNEFPRHDALYRFRMTGKARSLFSKVRFESGFLHKTEIDSFGSDVVFEDEIGRHRFVSREETDATVKRDQLYAEIQRLMELRKQIKEQCGNNANCDDEITKGISGHIKRLSADASKLSNVPHSSPAACPDGMNLQRRFQVIGPEGATTFNPDQRLIMAMTSSGEPLISGFKQLSKVLLTGGAATHDFSLPLIQENFRTLRAMSELDRSPNPDESVGAMIERVIASFNQDAPQKKP